LSSTYYPAADPGDHEHELVKRSSYPHYGYGSHLGYIEVGTPGSDKGDMCLRPIFHITLPDEGKVAADVNWAKLWFYCPLRVGSPQGLTYHLARILETRADWYDFYTHETTMADYTCWQHSGAAWTVPWGDYTTPQADFAGPSATGWFSVDITDLIKDAITNRVRDLNALIWVGDQASTSWNFYCKHSLAGSPPVPYNRWYVEVEWASVAAARGYAQVIG